MGAGGRRVEEVRTALKAVVLVGGEGTRLRPLTETIPKPLLPLMGRPFLHFVLDHLLANGIHEAILSSPYLEEAFSQFIEDRHGDPKITWVTEPEPLGTGGAVLNALDMVDGSFFVLNGDILTDLDLQAMLASHEANSAAATISTIRVEDARPFGLVVTGENARVLEFREKPADPMPGDINAGTYLLEPEALEGFPRAVDHSIEREVFPKMIERRLGVFAFPSQAYWLDLGTPEKYLRAHFDMIEGKIGPKRFSGPVVDESARVDRRAQLGRWVVIGPRAEVMSEAEVDESVLLEGSRVGARSKVRRSILGPGARVGEGALVTSTIVAEGAEVRDGASVVDEKVRAENP